MLSFNVIFIACFGLMEIALSGLLWGVTGYVFFRALGGDDRRWLIPALTVGTVYFLWEEMATTQVLGRIGISIADQDVAHWVGDAMASVDLLDVFLDFGTTLVGFHIGIRLLRRIAQHMTAPHHPVA